MSLSHKNLRLLVVEDDKGDVFLVRRSLPKAISNSMMVAGDLASAVKVLSEQAVDLVLCDLHLPDSRGLATFEVLQEASPKTPFVIMSGLDDENTALTAVASGAQDYLVKDDVQPKILNRVIRHSLERHRIFQELEEARSRERFLATHDPLTGLANRSLFFNNVEGAIARAERYHKNFAVLFLDLDRFKPINDTYGHDVGDELLKEVANRLRSIVRATDSVARLGGDEFTLIIEDLESPSGADGVANKISEAIAQPFVIKGQALDISASIGVAIYPDNGLSANELLKSSDLAMYNVKHAGRSGVRRFVA